ncbi:helix-turn-helix domain-containing protein [Escherichia coli]
MLHTTNPVIKHKAGLLNLAEELSNVSKACKIMGVSRDTFFDTLQSDLDEWLAHYNNERTHQGKMCNGRTPMETLLDGKRIWAEKNLSQM